MPSMPKLKVSNTQSCSSAIHLNVYVCVWHTYLIAVLEKLQLHPLQPLLVSCPLLNA